MKKVREILAAALFTAAAAVAVLGSSRSAAQHAAADRKVYQPAFSVAAIVTHDAALAGAHDIELQGDLAFVAGKGGSLAVVDIKNPRSPRVVWFNPDAGALEDAETVLPLGRHLLVGTRDFHSFDLGNPHQPVRLATVSDRTHIDRINGFARRGTLVVAANKEGWIDAFDIKDPAAPRLFGALNVRQRDGLFNPHDIDVVGDYTVTAGAEFMGRENRAGRLAVHRIAAGPNADALPVAEWQLVRLVESADLAGANRVQVHGQYAYVGCSIAPDALHLRHGRGVVVDVADPTQARQVASVEFAGQRGPNGLTLAGKVWFLAGGQTVEALDISDPTAPRKLVTFRLAGVLPTANDNAHDLVYRDGYLYLTGQGDHRLVILQVHDPDVLRLAAAQ